MPYAAKGLRKRTDRGTDPYTVPDLTSHLRVGPLRVEHTTARPVPERGRLLSNPLRLLGDSLKGEDEKSGRAAMSVVSG
jgi:hypothetical protein